MFGTSNGSLNTDNIKFKRKYILLKILLIISVQNYYYLLLNGELTVKIIVPQTKSNNSNIMKLYQTELHF